MISKFNDSSQLSADTVVISTKLAHNAKAVRQLLEIEEIDCMATDSIETVITAIRAEVSLVIITEEVLAIDNNFDRLAECLNKQPDWSDIPLIFLLKNCRHFSTCMTMLQSARHQRGVTLLETPLQRHEFTSIVQVCLSNRQRQFQLRDTLERLHESNRELENFSHTVAHELRNPLNVVTVSLDLLQESELESRNQKIVQMGLQTSRKMNQTLNALLEYGKLKSRRNLKFEPVDLNLVVEQAVNGLQNTIDTHQASIDWSNLPIVKGNAKLLENLVSNLIKNAIVHNQTSTPVVMVYCELKNDRYLVRLTDNGPGILPEEQEKIFQLFVRGGEQRAEGSGIGLALCQRIVEQHDGKLGVESDLGRGSTFYFDLPKPTDQDA